MRFRAVWRFQAITVDEASIHCTLLSPKAKLVHLSHEGNAGVTALTLMNSKKIKTLLSPTSLFVSTPFLPVKKEGNRNLSAEHIAHSPNTTKQRVHEEKFC